MQVQRCAWGKPRGSLASVRRQPRNVVGSVHRQREERRSGSLRHLLAVERDAVASHSKPRGHREFVRQESVVSLGFRLGVRQELLCIRAVQRSLHFLLRHHAEQHQRVVQFIGVACVGQASIRTFSIAAASRMPRPSAAVALRGAPGVNRLGATFLQRRVVEKRIGSRIENLGRERRRLGQIARDAARSSPCSILRNNSSKPSMSIASVRQS